MTANCLLYWMPYPGLRSHQKPVRELILAQQPDLLLPGPPVTLPELLSALEKLGAFALSALIPSGLAA